MLQNIIIIIKLCYVGNLYKAEPSIYGETGLKAYSKNDSSQSSFYLLASRDYDAWGNGSFGFALHYITSEGILNDVDWFLRDYGRYSGWTNESMSGRIRPIITLKSQVNIGEGEGSKEKPYTLTLASKNSIVVNNDEDKGNIDIKNLEAAEAGSKILFKIISKKGYLVSDIIIMDSNGNKIEYKKTDNKDEYEFIMPNSSVTIKPVYKKIDNQIINPETGNKLSIIVMMIIVSGLGSYLYQKNKLINEKRKNA